MAALGTPLSPSTPLGAPHVYAADQGLQLQNETVDSIMYDDAAMLLLVFKGGVVFAYDVAADVPTQHEQLVWTYPLQEGPPVMSARCSLDRRSLALQRSKVLVELVDLPSGNISVMHSDKGRSELLGMFHSEWPDAQLVLLSRAGLELCTYAARRQGLHSRERLRLPVHWYQYSHETRCCLVATGPPLGPPYLQAWQFLPTGLLTLPSFALSLSSLGNTPSPQLSAMAPGGMGHDAGTNTSDGGGPASAGPATPATGAGPAGDNEPPLLPISTHASVRDDAPRGRGGSGLSAAGIAPPPTRSAASGSAGANTAASANTTGVSSTTRLEEAATGTAAAAVRKLRIPVGSLTSWLGGGGGGGAASEVIAAAGGGGPGGAETSAALQSSLWPDLTVGAAEVVPSSAVRVLKMYGRVFCAHINASTRKLDLYRLFTDTVVLQHSYPVPSTRLRLSVVDNVLVVHQPATCSAMLIDVCADGSAPVVPMRPLGHLAPLRRPRQLHEERQQQLLLRRQSRSGLPTGLGSPPSGTALPGGEGAPTTATLPPPILWSVVDEEEGALLPHTAWTYHLPNLIVDVPNQVVYRMLLDIHAITRDASSPVVLAAFLQRRRSPRLHVQAPDTRTTEWLRTPGASPALLALPTTIQPAHSSPSALPAPARWDEHALHHPPQVPGDGVDRTPAESASAHGGGGPSDASLFRPGTSAPPAVPAPGSLMHRLMESEAPTPPRMLSGNDLALVGGSSFNLGPHPVMLSGVITPTAITSKLLLQHRVASMLQDELPLVVVRQVFDALNKAYGEVALAAANGRASPVAAACVLSPGEVVSLVLRPLCGEPAKSTTSSGAATGPSQAAPSPLTLHRHTYLRAVVWELTASVVTMGIRPPTGLLLLGASLTHHPPQPAPDGASAGSNEAGHGSGGNPLGQVQLARLLHVGSRELYANLTPAQLRGLGGPSADHAADAKQALLCAATPGPTPAQPSAAGGEHGAALVRQLLAAGQVVRAARLARQLHVTAVPPVDIAQAAARAGDVGALAAVYRCFRAALMPDYPSFESLQTAVATGAGG